MDVRLHSSLNQITLNYQTIIQNSSIFPKKIFTDYIKPSLPLMGLAALNISSHLIQNSTLKWITYFANFTLGITKYLQMNKRIASLEKQVAEANLQAQRSQTVHTPQKNEPIIQEVIELTPNARTTPTIYQQIFIISPQNTILPGTGHLHLENKKNINRFSTPKNKQVEEYPSPNTIANLLNTPTFQSKKEVRRDLNKEFNEDREALSPDDIIKYLQEN